MEENKLLYALEAILFASGDPVPADRLCAALDIERPALDELFFKLSGEYDRMNRGIRLIRLGDKLQMVSRPEYSAFIRAALESGKAPMLSPAAMEVLAIIAYKQPVTRAYIEQVRGVDSSYTISSLLDKGMIENCGRLDVPGRPALYRTSEKFLRSFVLTSVEQLPYIEGFDLGEPDGQMTLDSLEADGE